MAAATETFVHELVVQDKGGPAITQFETKLGRASKTAGSTAKAIAGLAEEQTRTSRAAQIAAAATEKSTGATRIHMRQTEQAVQGLQKYVNVHDPLLKMKRQWEIAENAVAVAQRRGVEVTDDQLQTVERLRQNYEKAKAANDNLGKSHEGAARSTKLAAHEVTNLSYQLQDAAVQLAGGQNPFLILMQQGPQATGAVGGVGRAMALLASPLGIATMGVAAFVAGAGLLASRATQIEGQTRALATTMRAYGTEAQMTAAQLRDVAKALYADGVDKADASAATKTLASTRGLSGGMAQQIALLGSDMAAGLGKTVDETVKQLAEMAVTGYPAIKKLQDAIGFLSAEEMNAVRTMSEHGEQTRALSIVLEALHRRFDGLRQQSMSPTDKALRDIATGWNGFMDAVAQSRPVMDMINSVSGAVTRMAAAVTSTPHEQIADLQAELDDLNARKQRAAQARASGGSYVYLTLFGVESEAELEQKIASAQARLREAQRRAVEGLPAVRRRAGTFAGASSYGNKVDPIAVQYVDDESAAYTRLAQAMSGSRRERALALADMKAEDEIRDKKLSGLEAENIRILRRREAMLDMSTSYRDEMESLSLGVKGNIDLANAYGISEAAAIRQRAANEAVAAAAGNAAVNVAELTRQNVLSAASNTAADMAKSVTDMQRQVEWQRKIVEASREGSVARAEAQRQAEVEQQLAPTLAAAMAAEAAGAGGLAQNLRSLAEAYRGVSKESAGLSKLDSLEQYRDQQADTLEGQRLELSLVGKSASEIARATALRQAELEMKYRGIDLTKSLSAEEQKLVDTIRNQALAQADNQVALDRVRASMATLEAACQFPDEVLNDPECIEIFAKAIR